MSRWADSIFHLYTIIGTVMGEKKHWRHNGGTVCVRVDVEMEHVGGNISKPH